MARARGGDLSRYWEQFSAASRVPGGPAANDAGSKTSGFGVGELGQVPESDLAAEAEAERLQPSPRRRPGRKYMSCRRCHQGGYVGDHPFSTCPSSGLCDDCFG